ncbi:MAG: hypothetical protein JST23_06060 [Bacteroidetes bacterium]|nr:hypothetical protein [Bacteroidota bacterium]
MESEILFSERQRFKQWWIWLLILCINGLFLFGVFKQIINGQPFGDKPMSNSGLLFATSITLLCSLLFLSIRLDSQIRSDGVYVRYFPFRLKLKKYTWSEISQCYVRQYSPIAEYGGWGYRIGLFGKGRALNVSGNKGLQLEFTNGKKLLIGTNKPEEITEVLRKIKQV